MSARLKKKPWSKSSKSDDNDSIKSANTPAEAKSSTGAKSSPEISLLANPSAPMSSVSDGPRLSRKDMIHMEDREGRSMVRPVRLVLPEHLTSTVHNDKTIQSISRGENTQQTQRSSHYAAQSSTVPPRTSSRRPSPSPKRVPLQVRKTSPEPAKIRYNNPFEGHSKEPNTPEPMEDDGTRPPQADILHWYLFKLYRLELLKSYYQQKAKKVEQLESQLALKSVDSTRHILDDSAYIARFHLLDKIWLNLPFSRIEQFNLNQDPKLKKIQARASLTEWLILHPRLKLQESLILKDIERNIVANNERKLSSEPKDDVVPWRFATLKTRLDPNFLNQQGERDALKKTLHYQDHRRAVLSSFGDYFFSTSLDTQLFGPDGSMNESCLTGLDTIIEEVLILISFMSLETRNIAVYLIPPGSMYSSKRMRVPEDEPTIGLCAFLGLQKIKDGQAAVLYQPEVYFKK
ncbi:hypothetical protein V1527DRAFT_518649 [Lipomyces starkeyi]